MSTAIRPPSYPVARSTPPPVKTPGPYVPTSPLEKVALKALSFLGASRFFAKLLVSPVPLSEVKRQLAALSGGGEEIHHFIDVVCPYLAKILEKSLHESSGIHSSKVFAHEFLDAVMPHIFLNAAKRAHIRHKVIPHGEAKHALLADVIGQFALVASVHCHILSMKLKKKPEPLVRAHFIPFSDAVLKVCFPNGHLDLPFTKALRTFVWFKLNLELPDILLSFYKDLKVSEDTILHTHALFANQVGQFMGSLLRSEGEKQSKVARFLASEIIKELQPPTTQEERLKEWLTVQLGLMGNDHRKQLSNFWYFIVRYIVPTLPAAIADALYSKVSTTTNSFLA